MQLVSSDVRVLYPRAGRAFSDTVLFDEAAVQEKYGVPPEHIADLKALVGDASDNIPGVPGIGDKTAVKLIQEFGSLEDIYSHINEVTPPKTQELLRQNEAVARRSKELATIVRKTPVALDLDECRASQFDRRQVADFFRELEFYSLLNKLPGAEEEPSAALVAAGPAAGDYRVIASAADLDDMVNRLSSAKSFAFDTETTGLNPMTSQLVGISLACEAAAGTGNRPAQTASGG